MSKTNESSATPCGVGGCRNDATYIAHVHWFSDRIDAALAGHVFVCDQHADELKAGTNAGTIHLNELVPIADG